MHRLLPLLGITFVFPTPTDAQTDREQVIDVAQALFDAMRRHDGAAVRAVMLPDARLLAVGSDAGRVNTAWTTADDFANRIAQRGAELLERMWNPKVEIDGAIASLWTEYDFHRDRQFSHCGIDAFHMVRTDGGWKIAQITYNRRTEGCYSPLGR